MAIYPYVCDKCHKQEERFQSPNEEHTATCPRCHEAMRRIYTSFTTIVEFRPGFDMGAGKHFDTKRERDTYLSVKGLRKVRD